MYKVTGQIINLFNSPATEKFGAAFRVQLLGDMQREDGQIKKEMLTLNVPQPVYESLKGQVGKEATFPIGFYVKNNQIITFFPKSEANNVEI